MRPAHGGGADRFAEEAGVAVGRFDDAEEDLDEGRLAGAVLASRPKISPFSTFKETPLRASTLR